jgi:hypothetical protein
MMEAMIALVYVVGLVPAAQAPVPARDAAGRWNATFYSDGGTTLATMVLKKDGEKVLNDEG